MGWLLTRFVAPVRGWRGGEWASAIDPPPPERTGHILLVGEGSTMPAPGRMTQPRPDREKVFGLQGGAASLRANRTRLLGSLALPESSKAV